MSIKGAIACALMLCALAANSAAQQGTTSADPTLSQPQDDPSTQAVAAASDSAASYPSLQLKVAPEAVAEKADSRPVSSSRLIEEIIVTAQKREEAIQDVPISVVAFSAEQLSALGVDNTKDLGRVTPGLQFSEIAGFTIVYLRGIGTDSFLPYADPSVATYVDGLYIPAQQGLINSFGGIERVEVLKGPQGTLFGRNSTGGAINIITKTPGQVLEGSAQFDVGNFNARKLQAYVSVPVTDTLAAGLSVIYNHADSYYSVVTSDLGPTDSAPADKLGPDQSQGARLKLRWTPDEDLEFTVGGYALKQQGSGSTLGALAYPSLLDEALGIQAEQHDYKVHRDAPTALTVENSTLFGNGRWTLPWFDLKLIGGYQDILTKNAYYDFDNSAKSIVSFYTHNAYSKVTTGEFQITSNDSSWMADRLKWIAGLYYLHSLGGYDPIVLNVAGQLPLAGASLLTPAELAQVQAQLPLLGGIPGLILGPGVGAQLAVHGVLRTDSKSAFVQATYNVTDWMDVTLGGRYQTESRFLTKQNVQAISDDGSEVPVFVFHQPEVTQNNFSPKVSFDFKPMDDMLIYMTGSKGFKSGTYNGISIYEKPTYVQPEEVTAYELGLKSEYFHHALRFNAAIFQSNTKNVQVTYVSLVNGGTITMENAGSARNRGAEFDTLWLPMPQSNPGLVFTGGFTFLDSIFTDYKNGSGFDPTTGIFISKAYDFTGNRVPRTPKYSGNAGVNQTIDVANGSVELGVDGYYNSGFYYSAQNSPKTHQADYVLLNARASYLYDPWKLRVTAYVQNLGSEIYTYGQLTADFGTNFTLAPPRTYGIKLNWTF